MIATWTVARSADRGKRFFYFPFFLFACKRKNGRRKKAPSKDASLCGCAARRKVRPLASQRGLPGGNRCGRAVREAGPYKRDGTAFVFLVGGGGPGRNHRLLPALATNAPPAHLLNASRLDAPQRADDIRPYGMDRGHSLSVGEGLPLPPFSPVIAK